MRSRAPLWLAVLALFPGMVFCGAPARSAGIDAGKGEATADAGGVPLRVFTYRPDGCAVTSILLVFHGLNRNARDYRDFAIPLGQSLCMLVVAPLFDTARFPVWRYQRGGIVHDGAPVPEGGRTVDLVPPLIAWVRARENRPELPYAMIGHSAGAQYLGRVAAFEPNQAASIVIANPSTWVRPTLDIDAPYGFGGVYPPGEGEAALRRYLAEPVTVLLGMEDTGSRNLVTDAEAEDQGATRLGRGQNVFREAEAAARLHGWTFNWRLSIVPGVAHDAARMFGSDHAAAALRAR